MVLILHKEDWFPEDGFPIVVARREPQEPFGPHAHDFSELVLVTGGRGVHTIEGESWPLSAGDVFVIQGERPHQYENLDDLRLINLLYDPRGLQLPLADLTELPGYHALFSLEPIWRSRHQFRSRLHLKSRDLTIVAEMIDRLETELTERPPGFAFFAKAQFMLIVGHLARSYGESRNPDSRALLRIGEAIAYLERHYADPIDLDVLAGIAGMAKRSFQRDFQRAMGASPIAYLISLRVRRAAEMLRRGELSVSEIAFRVGFEDSNYFSRQFRKVMGASPREYRKRLA